MRKQDLMLLVPGATNKGTRGPAGKIGFPTGAVPDPHEEDHRQCHPPAPPLPPGMQGKADTSSPPLPQSVEHMYSASLARIQSEISKAVHYHQTKLPGMPPAVSEVAAATTVKHKQMKLLPCSCEAGDFKAHKLPAAN